MIAVDENLRKEHPGGPEAIAVLAGRDATADFEDIGHSDNARAWAQKLVVGRLEGEHKYSDSVDLVCACNG